MESVAKASKALGQRPHQAKMRAPAVKHQHRYSIPNDCLRRSDALNLYKRPRCFDHSMVM
jgi:hypothetical protein